MRQAYITGFFNCLIASAGFVCGMIIMAQATPEINGVPTIDMGLSLVGALILALSTFVIFLTFVEVREDTGT